MVQIFNLPGADTGKNRNGRYCSIIGIQCVNVREKRPAFTVFALP